MYCKGIGTAAIHGVGSFAVVVAFGSDINAE